MERQDLARWIESYERAWRTTGTTVLEVIFADAATYRPAPFDSRLEGRAAIAGFWEREREGPDESFTLTWEPIAIEGDVGVARVEVHYETPSRLYRNLWVVKLDADGRCVEFEEWPFFPEQMRESRSGATP